MNTKKSKHKKPNKPPNPNPPQKSEVTKNDEILEVKQKIEEIVETQPKCEVKEDISKNSEVVEPVSEVEKQGEDTPKKPKRNKGKKKKDQDDFEKEKSVDVPKEILNPVQEPVKEAVSEKGEERDLLDESVIPSARKKKNKKKNHEKNDEELQFEETEVNPKQPTKPSVEVIQKVDPEIQELFSPIPETSKQDKKKKNKKKKRNDSEKSDKTEEVSCTTAFQQLLLQDESETKEANKENLIDDSQELAPIYVEEEKETIIPEIKEETKEVPATESLETKLTKEESKGKKKNKKDKKHQQPELIEETILIAPDSPIIVENVSVSVEIPSDELKAVLVEPMEKVLEAIEKEPSPKPKAKIAKPVEKKKKGKQDQLIESQDNVVESSEIKTFDKITTESSTMKSDDNQEIVEITKEPEIKEEYGPIPIVTESQVSDETAQTPILPEPEKINVPADNEMGKKRKKSPKPKKKEGGNVKDLPELAELLPEVDTIKKSVDTLTPLLSEINEPEKQVTFESPKLDSHIIEIESDESLIKLSEPLPKELDNPQKEQMTEIPLIPEMKVDDEGFETKTSKKKKKMPKTPQPESAKTVITAEKEDTQEKSKSIEEKAEIPLNISFSSELEVRSVKTDESDGSACEINPDILFIRSSSELFDNNNNTFIQEVDVEESKLNDPMTIPLIQGSGETPIPTPELISSDIRLPEFGTKTTDDKTDLKSKMMEVNQDMEELRLSIEKSLAEFTALDKDEQAIKKERDHNRPLKIKPTGAEEKCKPTKENIIPEAKNEILVKSDIKQPVKTNINPPVEIIQSSEPPVCPARKDNKGKGKSKKKGKQEAQTASTITTADTTSTQNKEDKEKSEKKSESSQDKEKDDSKEKGESDQKSASQEKGKQKSNVTNDVTDTSTDKKSITEQPVDESSEFEPIENFEDALTSSIDDVNKTFELIAKDVDDDNQEHQKKLADNKPEINVTEPPEDKNADTKRNEKTNPVSQPKNLLGHYDIPVQSNKTDYKKEKNKTPNARQAKVKIKDSVDIGRQSKESQTDTKRTKKIDNKSVKESYSKVKNENEEYVYKYSFRKVFLQSACYICNKDLSQVRVPCGYCNLVFYCGVRHKDEDWPQHQALCFAVSTLAHIKDQKHIYADAQHTTGQDYRLLRMQMIVSSEKVLKRRLVPWEQEAMLYPRLCADVACREWRQGKLRDCEGCAQLSYCSEHPEHMPKTHQRWCKSYSLYQKLVTHQQTKGRLETKLPTKVMTGLYEIPTKMNEVLASMYEEKIDMNDIQYAALTQIATAPLTTAYCLQLCRNKTSTNTNGVIKKQTFTIHVVGAELQFEADALNKWEVFFLHLKPQVQELKVVLVSKLLNPGNLPLDLLAKIKLCENCREYKRRVVFIFEDNKNYFEYRTSEDFINPDIICAFNPSIQRSSIYNGRDPWPSSINSILKLKTPFVVTSYTLNELRKDIARIKQCADNFKLILEPGFNNFASVRPDRNFISDDEMPLLFKNYCVAVVLGC